MGVGGQGHAPAALLPGKRPGTHCIGEWVGHRVGLNGYEKISHPTGNRFPDCPARSESLYRLSYLGQRMMTWGVELGHDHLPYYYTLTIHIYFPI